MEAAVDSGYGVVTGLSLELALLPLQQMEAGRRLDTARPCPSGLCFLLSLAPGHQHVWSESEDCLPFLQLAQDYISSCGKKTLQEVLEKVFKSFRPLLGLPDADDDAFEEYSADVEEEEPEADHPQMGVSQQ
ncbi:PREDICTED: maturin [Myotis davidii]|uniref:maturin n=1 Tax=Myotis davidii TaxID=225400 RepID=UPI000766E923|nr:PREDICTED: maturin [Myotis davidii]